MIKALTIINTRRTLMLGLSRENVQRLLNDQPIPVNLQGLLARVAEMDDVQDIILFAGETEDDMTEQLRTLGFAL